MPGHTWTTGDHRHALSAAWAALHKLKWLCFKSPAAELPVELQHSLSTLAWLRHLELHCSSRELPSVATLCQLTALSLSTCSQLEQLPPGIGELASLVHLCCSRCAGWPVKLPLQDARMPAHIR